MLRITVHEKGTRCRLELSGRLEGPWVAETDYAWRSSSRSAKQIEVDMRQLTGVDDSGRMLLSAMHRAGARLVVEGVWLRALIREITGKQPIDGAQGQSRRKKSSCMPTFPNQEKP